MSDAAPTARILKFVSSDGKEFLIPADIIKMSATIKDMILGLGLDDLETTNADPIPLSNVDGKTLEKVLTWCKHHQEHPTEVPVEGEGEEKKLSEYATEFFDISDTEIFEVILAANFLNIPDLQAAGCKTIADEMKGMTIEEIRERFGVVNDFNAEEQELIRRENAWCED